MANRTTLASVLLPLLVCCGAQADVAPAPLERIDGRTSPEAPPLASPPEEQGAGASSGGNELPETLAPQLDALLDEVVADGTVGLDLYVRRGGHEPYHRSRGFANLDAGEALTPKHLFRVASISKPYLSVLVTKLAVEGRLGLGDPISAHLPADIAALVPGADVITIYDLLTLWSGIADYRDTQFTLDVLFGDHAKVRDEYTDLVDGLRRNPTPCAPPELPKEQVTPEQAACLYSNANYVLAGYIVDKVLYGVDPAPGARPEHHAKAMREELFEPLGLRSIFYEKHLAPGESFFGRLARGYASVPTPEGGVGPRADVTTWDDGYGYANGGLVATLDDEATFRRAVFDRGRAYPMRTRADKARLLDLLTTTNPLGVAPGGITRGEYWAFSGDIGGHTCWSQYAPTRDTSIALCSNDRDFEASKYDFVAKVEAIVASENRRGGGAM